MSAISARSASYVERDSRGDGRIGKTEWKVKRGSNGYRDEGGKHTGKKDVNWMSALVSIISARASSKRGLARLAQT
jgi:hypothetical protein